MVQIMLNGDFSKVSMKQLDFITKILKERGYNNSKVTFQQVGDPGDNTSAHLKRIVVEKKGETFYMIAKLALTEESDRNVHNTRDFFNNEHVMYTEVLPKFKTLEIEAKIPPNERLRFAECYGSSMEMLNEVILLEDLRESHFAILDKFKSLTNNTVKLVLKYFARFHTLSYALKAKDPETFNEFNSKLVNPREGFDALASYFTGVEEDTIALFHEQKYKDAMMGTLSNLKEMMIKLKKSESNSSFNVIEQGDTWTNNIMLKMQDGEPTACCLIDYQMSRVNSPVTDLYYMIFNCTDYETRGKYFLSWLDYYHTELGESLSKFGLELDTVYPRKQLNADLKRYAKLLLTLCLLMATALARDAAKIAKLRSLDTQELDKAFEIARVSQMDPETQAIYKKIVKELIDSFIDFGFM